MPARASLLQYVAGLALIAALGCNIDNPGDEPPRGLLYFPNAVALSKHENGDPARYLFVANSDFDLRYKHGSLQAYSLEDLEREVDACRGKADCAVDTDDVLEDEILISPFSTALAVSGDGRTLFSATRTDKNLGSTRLDAEADGDDVLTCSASGDCPVFARSGEDPNSDDDKDTRLSWPPDPVMILSGSLSDVADGVDDSAGNFVLVAHRGGTAAGGQMSLFVRCPGIGGVCQQGELLLVDTLSGLSPQLTSLALDPETRLVHFSVTSGAGFKFLGRVGVVVPRLSDGGADVQHAFLYDAGPIQLDGVAPFADTRDVAFVPKLATGGVQFEGERALVLSRDPSALLLVDVTPQNTPEPDPTARSTDEVPYHARVARTAVVGLGASRVVTGEVAGKRLAIVTCFDSRELFVIDLQTMLVAGVVPNLSGPFDLALDEARQLVYVADFRSSVIRVIDLAPLSEGRGDQAIGVVATVGKPRILQELQ
jgi:hypothetical protein